MRQPGEVSRWRVIALALLVSGSGAAERRTGGGPVELEPGGRAAAEIGPGEVDRYALRLRGDSYLRVRADQAGVDVALSLAGPDGARLARADVLGQPWVTELLSAVVDSSGVYRIEVEPSPGETRHGSYRLLLETVRPARGDDGVRVEAERRLQEGWDLLERHGRASADAAGERLDGALAAARRLDDPGLEGEVLLRLAGVHYFTAGPRAAVETLELAVDRRRLGGDDAATARTLNRLGQLLHELGDVEAARARLEEALELARGSDDAALEAFTLNNLGALDHQLGRIDDAAERLGRALVLYRRTGDDAGRATTLGNLGVIHRQLGRLDEAFAAYREALALARRMGDVENEFSVVNNLGVLYRVRGEIQRALETYTRGLEAVREAGGLLAEEADLNSNLGWLWHLLGFHERALEHHRRALELNREIGRRSAEAGELMRIGWLWESIGEPARALAVLEQALPIAEAAGDLRNQSRLHTAIGRAKLESGETEPAVAHLRRALVLAEEASDEGSRVAALRDLGRALERNGDVVAARAALEAALEAVRTLGDPYQEASVRLALARPLRRQGELEAARRELVSALSVVEGLRSDLASQEYRASFLARRQDDYVYLVDLLLEMHQRQPERRLDLAAFSVSERSRARSFVELLAEAMTEARSGLDPRLAERERQISQQIAWAQRRLSAALSRVPPDAGRVAEQRAELERLQRDLERIEWELRQRHPRYAEVRYPQPVEVTAVQAMLEPDAALLVYLLGEPRSFLFVVTADRFRALPLAAASEILPDVRRARQALASPGRRQAGRLRQVAPRLYQRLVAPALELLEGKRCLRIAPDGELYHLPFEALLETRPEEAAAPAYLISRWAVSYVPSASALAGLRHSARERQPRERPRQLLAFGDPWLPGTDGDGGPSGHPGTRRSPEESWRWRRLPGTRREVEAIASLFPPETREVYLGPDALESRFKRSLTARGSRFVHLASHAYIDSRRPAYSSLLMSPEEGGTEDGLLQVHEIFRLRLPSELVVLSACQTGLGRQIRGEGLIGLSRAFLYAGARAVTVSLWPVADLSTADLMQAFYRGMADGLPKTEALRQAKLRLLRDGRFSQPYYWAPFVLVGDAS